MKLDLPQNAFKRALKAGQAQIGLWSSLSSNYTVEVIAGAGFDWILLDMEHSPNDLESLLAQLQAAAPYPTHPVVRVPWNDMVTIKRVLDVGAQSLLIPYVQNAAEAKSGSRQHALPAGGRARRGAAPRAPRASGASRTTPSARTRRSACWCRSRPSRRWTSSRSDLRGRGRRRRLHRTRRPACFDGLYRRDGEPGRAAADRRSDAPHPQGGQGARLPFAGGSRREADARRRVRCSSPWAPTSGCSRAAPKACWAKFKHETRNHRRHQGLRTHAGAVWTRNSTCYKLYEAADRDAFLKDTRAARARARDVRPGGRGRQADGRAAQARDHHPTSASAWTPIDLAAAKKRGIIVTNTPDVLNDCVADTAMSLVLERAAQVPAVARPTCARATGRRAAAIRSPPRSAARRWASWAWDASAKRSPSARKPSA